MKEYLDWKVEGMIKHLEWKIERNYDAILTLIFRRLSNGSITIGSVVCEKCQQQHLYFDDEALSYEKDNFSCTDVDQICSDSE